MADSWDCIVGSIFENDTLDICAGKDEAYNNKLLNSSIGTDSMKKLVQCFALVKIVLTIWESSSMEFKRVK